MRTSHRRFDFPRSRLSASLAAITLLLAACDSSSSSSQVTTASPEPQRAPSAAAKNEPTRAAPSAVSATPVGASSASVAASAAAPAPPKPPADIPAPPDVAEPPKTGATKSPTGLVTKVLTPGKGKVHPKDDERVKVHYTGWTKDGKMFDSSIPRGEPTMFGVTEVIKGWTEGLKLMVVGEKRRMWIPAALAYGDRAPPGAPTGQLTFDVELLDIVPAPKPPPVPTDVKGPPAGATKTASGLAYRLLKPGKGTQQPKATDRVTVNYTGWTTDGKMFDSSIVSGEPASFALNQVIKGWTEGLQLMHVGDSMRFWIPAELAYGDKPKRAGAPAGMLVFDVELLSIP